MCGIVGFISSDKVSEDTLSKMLHSIDHRGPNDDGYHYSKLLNKNIFLGHTRLSILDTSFQGHQPMISNDGNFELIYNGEVYNYIEIREELKAKGYLFDSSSDTEVVLKSFIEWGSDCFAKFNGMWALAIYDRVNKKIILSRDRVGKKPLYYYRDNDKFIFASEIKAILKYPNLEIKPNLKKVYKYLSTNYRYIDIDTESYFENIYQIEKSNVVEIDLDLNMTSKKYWELKEFNNSKKNEKDTIEEFKELIVDSVRLRLRSDVPVGCFLSGGMDSTSITSIAYKVLKTPIMTFSGITGEEKGIYDETEYINEVIKETNAKYRFIKPDPTDIFDTIDEMLDYHDEPICTVTWYSLYLIVKNMKDSNVPVVLNGHGGDELLAGYWDHYQYNFYDLKNDDKLEYEIKNWYKNHKRDMSEIEKYKLMIEKVMNKEEKEIDKFPDYSYVFSDDFQCKFNLNIELDSIKCDSILTKRMYKELFYETVPASLRAEDRNTMAHSIESRSPFLDHRLIEYCYALDNKYKIRDGIGKWILRESMKGILPEKVRTRKDKAGFIAPADEWFRTINKDQIIEMLGSKEFEDLGIFNINVLREVYGEHLGGEKNHQMFLWQLINIYLWYKKFFMNEKK
ncbi:MAG: asparagine synthase (glutamine-hydrolyzing) [Epsilonproteobacteria bacterium]|nr:asparagine synthase (glutamine-hydrolyzing) [Campylobacterota bacterium]